MNHITKNNPYDVIKSQSSKFSELASSHKAVKFSEECEFAKQALGANNFLFKVADQNPSSLKDAILNVAMAGITLNPVHQKAYLVPRKGRICLDVSYRGLIHLASVGGMITWVQATIVKEKDVFTYNGLDKMPDHNFHPFLGKKRGPIVGAYCVTKLKNGDFLTHMIDIDAINSIRDRSESYKAYLNKGVSCPWVTDFEEMAKKTCVKQASKYWPKSDKGIADRLEAAISSENDANGTDFAAEKNDEEVKESVEKVNYQVKMENFEEIKSLLTQLTHGMEAKEKFLFMKEQCKVSSLNDLKRKRVDDINAVLNCLRGLSKNKKVKKPEERKVVEPEVVKESKPRTAKDVSFKL